MSLAALQALLRNAFAVTRASLPATPQIGEDKAADELGIAIWQNAGVDVPDPLEVDVINEDTSNHGVIVEDVLIKDGLVDGKDVANDFVEKAGDTMTGALVIDAANGDGEDILHFGLEGARDWVFEQNDTGVYTGLRLRSVAGKDFNINTDGTVRFRKGDGTTSIDISASLGRIGIGKFPGTFDLELLNDSAAKPLTNTWDIASDKKLKENIRPFEDGLAIILQIDPKRFKFNGLAKQPQEEAVGIIAQDVKDLLPDCIGTMRCKLHEEDVDEVELLTFNSHALLFIVVNAIKEQAVQVASLMARAKEQLEINKSLMARLTALENK